MTRAAFALGCLVLASCVPVPEEGVPPRSAATADATRVAQFEASRKACYAKSGGLLTSTPSASRAAMQRAVADTYACIRRAIDVSGPRDRAAADLMRVRYAEEEYLMRRFVAGEISWNEVQPRLAAIKARIGS